MALELMKPTIELGPEYIAMVDESIETGEGYGYNNVELARSDFAAFVEELEEEAQGIGLLPGLPSQQTYLLVKDGKTVVGEFRFRPTITPPYEKFNGHVAYNIRPSQRNKEYATEGLALLLIEARRLNLPGVSLTIEGENPASARVIAKNGAKLLREIENPLSIRVFEEHGELKVEDYEQTGTRCKLYWIDLYQ